MICFADSHAGPERTAACGGAVGSGVDSGATAAPKVVNEVGGAVGDVNALQADVERDGQSTQLVGVPASCHPALRLRDMGAFV